MEKSILYQFINNISHYIWWKDLDSRFLGCNENCAKYIGLNCAEEIIGKTDFDIYDQKEDAERVRKVDKEIMQTGVAQLNFEESLIMPYIGKRWLTTSKIPWYDKNNNIIGTIGWFDDITEIKKMQIKASETDKALLNYSIQLKEFNKNLEIVNMDLEKFTYAASHDLKEPLRTMQSFAYLLKENGKDKFDEESMQYIEFIINSSKRMSNLIEDILNYAKTGSTELQAEFIDISQIVSNKIQDLKNLIDSKSVDLQLNLPKQKIETYPHLIGLVFYNLINNAIKFNNSSKPKIVCDYSETDDFWIFSIEDNGPGIDDEYKSQVFKPFKRLVGKEVKGTGLGLSICKRVITLHHGDIWIENSSEGNTIFKFSIAKSLSFCNL